MSDTAYHYVRNGLSLVRRNIYCSSEEIFFEFGGKSIPLRSRKKPFYKYIVYAP